MSGMTVYLSELREYGLEAWSCHIVLGLVYVKLDDVGKHAPLTPNGYHMYELYKQRSITNVVAAFFS